jgi:hypothetical protein
MSGGSARHTLNDKDVGMMEAEVETAIRPFHQVDERIARKYGGSGLDPTSSRR